MISYGNRSMRVLENAHPTLRLIFSDAARFLNKSHDVSLVESHRSVERQQELFKQGLTTLDGKNKMSKHNYDPSLAIDWYPFWHYRTRKSALVPSTAEIKKWAEITGYSEEIILEIYRQKVIYTCGVLDVCAELHGAKLRHGWDWNSNGYSADHNFIDFPHTELVV